LLNQLEQHSARVRQPRDTAATEGDRGHHRCNGSHRMSLQQSDRILNRFDFEAQVMHPFAATEGSVQLAWFAERAHQLQPHGVGCESEKLNRGGLRGIGNYFRLNYIAEGVDQSPCSIGYVGNEIAYVMQPRACQSGRDQV
jgi:hypothetical protein